MPNELADKVIKSLEPYIGKVIAQASLKTQCAKLGIPMDSLDPSYIDKLAELISKAMESFGKDGDKINQAIKSVV